MPAAPQICLVSAKFRPLSLTLALFSTMFKIALVLQFGNTKSLNEVIMQIDWSSVLFQRRYSMRTLAIVAVLCWSPGSTQSFAQLPPETMKRAASQAADLQFPTEASRPTVQMGIFKPDGSGPFPALVLLHQCGGLLAATKNPNISMLDWAKEAVGRGYVAFLLDSMSQRGAKTLCEGPQMGVSFPRGAKDVLQAVEHLRSLPYVDKKRIAMAGFSWGAMVGVLASSKSWGTALAPGERVSAIVSFYPGCPSLKFQSGVPYEIANPDIDRPLLVLMGEDDTETLPSVCVPKLEAAKAAGAPVEWHVYPKTTHCFDCRQKNGATKTVDGRQVTYHYDEKVTEDATRRLFTFLDKSMPKVP
jgi:dienelactone hydrolase